MATVGLALQGGGSLGAFQWGVAEGMEEAGLRPDLFAGVSIGAVNAVLLAAGRGEGPLDAIRAMWTELTASWVGEGSALLGNPAMYLPRIDAWNAMRWTGLYDLSPLRATLLRHVDFDRLRPGSGAPRVMLLATDVAEGRLEPFDSARMAIDVSHVLAACSLPPAFPATVARTERGELRQFWDAGVFDNSVLPALLARLADDGEGVDLLVTPRLFPRRGGVPTDMQGVWTRLFELLFTAKLARDAEAALGFEAVLAFAHAREEAVRLAFEALPEGAVEARAAVERLRVDPIYRRIDAWARILPNLLAVEDESAGPIAPLADWSPVRCRERRERGELCFAKAWAARSGG